MKFSSPEQYVEKTSGFFGSWVDAIGKGVETEAAKGMGEVSLGSKTGLKMGLGGALLHALKEHPVGGGLFLGTLGTLGAAGGFKAMEGGRPGETYSYRINKNLNNLLDRIRYDEVAGEAFAKRMGDQSADALMGLASDMAAKTLDTVKAVTMESPARTAIFSALRKEDPIIGQADMKTLNDAFHTMTNVAPSLATDKNAVKSVLRLAATSGGGLDYQTIKGLADAETSLKKARGEYK